MSSLDFPAIITSSAHYTMIKLPEIKQCDTKNNKNGCFCQCPTMIRSAGPIEGLTFNFVDGLLDFIFASELVTASSMFLRLDKLLLFRAGKTCARASEAADVKQ